MAVWLKAQLQCFPEDEEMLSFGEANSDQRDEEWMRTTSVILTLTSMLLSCQLLLSEALKGCADLNFVTNFIFSVVWN
mgnify:CR=1 FL=1